MMTSKVFSQTPTEPRVLAIDPGYERMGVAIMERAQGRDTVLYSGCVTTASNLPFPERLAEISRSVKDLATQWSPHVCAIEKLYFSKNQKTAMRVAEVRGVITEAAHSLDLGVVEYDPHEVKLAVAGYGNASKAQVADMVRRLVSISHIPKYDDEYDAVAIGLTHLASKKEPA